MKDLDRSKVYSLEGIKKDKNKFNQLKDWLKKSHKDWDNEILSDIEDYSYIYYSEKYKQWDWTYSEGRYICALTLFEEFIPNTVIEISKNGTHWFKRVLLLIKNNKAICWENAETIEEADKTTCTLVWPYYRNIKPKTILTKQQIADKFGIDINLLNIIDE